MTDQHSHPTGVQFLDRLRAALQADGDFPASARIVNDLRLLISDPKTTANQVTEVILREPSLGARILHLVNSSFFQRARPIMTVSQAVIQLGMRAIAEMCAGLILLQRFVPAARNGSTFAQCLQRTILTSLLTGSISAESAKVHNHKSDECGYLAGSFLELGPLLLAYYFPQVHENALKRADSKKISLATAIHELLGITPTEISLEVLAALKLPDFYRELLLGSAAPPSKPLSKGSPEQIERARIIASLQVAHEVSDALVSNRDQAALTATIKKFQPYLSLPTEQLTAVIAELPTLFRSHCDSIDLPPPALPTYLDNFNPDATPSTPSTSPQEDAFMIYVQELRDALQSGESTAALITMTMETLCWHIKFDRVVLLLVSPTRQKLVGRMGLGSLPIDPRSIEQPILPRNPTLEVKALLSGCPTYSGTPLLTGGWPFVVLPIGSGERAVGIIYADRFPEREQDLTPKEQAAIGVLAEVLESSLRRER